MLFLVHGCATALLSRSSALALNESSSTSPCQQVLNSWKGSEGRGSLDQGGHCTCLLTVVVAITICSGSLGWGRSSEAHWKKSRAIGCHSQQALADSWQSGMFLPCSSYFIYVTVWGKHLAQHLTDTYPATESWEKPKQPSGITKCIFVHLKPYSLLSATRCEPEVTQLRSVKDRLKMV